MMPAANQDQLLAEFAAAVQLAQLHRMTLTLELTPDSKGNVRIRLAGIRGVSCVALLSATAIERGGCDDRQDHSAAPVHGHRGHGLPDPQA
jgi:hypothetical protein